MRKVIDKYRLWLLLSAVIYMLCALLETYFAIIIGDIVDNATNSRMKELLTNIVIAVVLMVVNLILYRMAIGARRTYVMRCITELKQRLMNSFYGRGVAAFNRKADSHYLNTLTNDMDLIESDYLLPKPVMVFYAAQFSFSIAALVFISWKAMLFFFLLFLIPIVVPQLLSGVLAKRKRKQSECNEAFTFVIKEQVQGMRDIVTNLSAGAFCRKFASVNQEQQQAKKSAGVMEGFVNELSSVCGGIAQLGCMAIGGMLVINGEMSVGKLIAAVQLLNSVFNPIDGFSQLLALCNASKPIRDKVDEELTVVQSLENNPIDISKNDISYVGFRAYYGKNPVTKEQITYLFPDGKTCAVIGDSGSGKTTLVKCLLKMHEEYEGDILFGEENIREISTEVIYRKIGYVPQDSYIFNDTIVQNVTMGKEYSKSMIENVVDKVQLTELVNSQTGILGDSGENLSGGEKQRIALARVLLRQPEILVFDEPTAALDPQNRDAINELIFALQGYTRIVITHDRRPEYLERFDYVFEM